MEVFLVVTSWLVFVSGLESAAIFTCPPNDSKPGECIEGNYPNECDCTKFWMCTTACYPYEQSCPANLHFSPVDKVCQQPSDAQCTASCTTTTTTTTTSAPSTTTTSQQSSVSSTPSTTTTTTTSGPPVQINPSIFFVARTSNIWFGRDPVPYEIEFDRRGDFDISDFSFTAPDDGLVFFALSAGYMSGQPANLRMEFREGGTDMINVRRRGSDHNGVDMSGRDVIYNVKAGDKITTRQFNPSGRLHSTTRGLETSWMGLSINNSMETVSAFSLGRGTSKSDTGIVTFDKVFVNTNNAWDGQSYTVPVTGTYLISMSAGADANQLVNVALNIDNVQVAGLYKNHGQNGDIVTFSRTLIYNLNAGQKVSYELLGGELWSNDRYQVSFSGFYCKPKYTPRVAWSVAMTTSWTSSGSTDELNPVTYDQVIVNEGNVFDSTTYKVTIPYAGFYYFAIGGGVQASFPLDISVVYNDGTSLVHLKRLSTTHNGVDTMARAAIWYLYSGDVLHVKAEGDTALYGDNLRKMTNFQGFLIYSTQ